MSNIEKTEQDLAKDIGWKVEKTSFRQCYERLDANIKFLVSVHPGLMLADFVAPFAGVVSMDLERLVKLETEGAVRFIPPYSALQADCERPGPYQGRACELRKELEKLMDRTVKCYYCPPAFFVQFTGERWY